jgi:predicted amidohydrolase YtcJ
VLTRTCAHIHAVNSAALQRAAVDPATEAPAGGQLDVARGLLYETAWGLLQRAMPAPRPTDYERWILAGTRHLLARGVTSATEAAVDPPLYDAYRRLESDGRLPVRMNLLHLLRPDLGGERHPLPEMAVLPRLRCDTVKLFADGGLSGNTAALSVPYRGEGGRGILRLERAELHALARHARRAGYRLAVHAIGDRALDEVLDAFARLFRDEPGGPSHRIEHFGLPTAAHIEAARALRVHVVTQPIFLRELAANFRASLPEALLDRCYPFGAMMRAGLSVAFSSDGPVVRDVAPLAGVAAAATAAWVPASAVGIADALRAYTAGGAAAQGDEHNRGMVKAGQWADLVVLERDPLSVPAAEVDRIRVTDVLVGGKPQEVSHD